MTRLSRRALFAALFAAVAAAGGTGCTEKSEAQPNPELGKPPDVPPGRGAGAKNMAIDPNASKAAPRK